MNETTAKRITLLGLAGFLLAVAARNSYVEVDVFQELALIREAVARGTLPKEDVFSYVPTIAPMVHHEWGTGAILYLAAVQSGLGGSGLILVKLALVAGITLACYFCARRSGAEDAVVGLLAPIAILLGSISFTNVRAHLFTLLFLAVLFLLVQEDRRGKRWWVGLWLALYVLWVNIHGGAILGIGFVALYGLERVVVGLIEGISGRTLWRQSWHLILLTAGMSLLLLATPYGLDYPPALWRSLMLDRPGWIVEWGPMWRLDDAPSRARALCFVLSAFIGAYALVRSRAYRAPGVLFLAVTAWQAIVHYHYLSVYAVAWACVIPPYIQTTSFGQALKDTWEHKQRALQLVWAILFLYGGGSAVSQRFWCLRVPALPETEYTFAYPVGAVDYLRSQRFTGNLMTPFNAGAYVLWNLHPEVKVSVDCRFEVAYPTDWVLEVVRMYAGADGWRETLNRYPTDAVLVPRGTPLEQRLTNAPSPPQESPALAWRRVYVDEAYSLFARADGAADLPEVDRTGVRITGTFP